MQDTMETRGVASVRSPVCNLQQQYEHVKHESFVEAVVDAFREEYDVHEEVRLAVPDFFTVICTTQWTILGASCKRLRWDPSH